jgi:hypothetical protein
MTHLDFENLIADYLDGMLEAGRLAEAEAHLASCNACREVVEDVRFAISNCRAAHDVEPAPWLVSRILNATTGERKPGFVAELVAWLRPALRPQVIYGVSMAVFSLSFILFVAKANLRSLSIREFNPATWVERANSRGHLLVARAEKFYYDLRFVYEVQSVLRELRQQPSPRPAKPGRRNGGTSKAQPLDGARLAFQKHSPTSVDAPAGQGLRLVHDPRSLRT